MFNEDEDSHNEPYDLFISPKEYRQNLNNDTCNKQNQNKLKGHSLSFLQRRAATARCQDEGKGNPTQFQVTTKTTCNAVSSSSSSKTTSFATSTFNASINDTSSLASHRFSLDRGRSFNQPQIQQRISYNSQNNQAKYATCSLKYGGRLSSLSFNTYDHRRPDRANSISNCSNDSQATLDSSLEQQPHSFITHTNMIAKLASSSTSVTQKPGGQTTTTNASAAAMTAAALQASNSVPLTSAQSKRKRSKLLDLLLNTNWSKQSQQASHLMKLNKVLLFCDANFLDEKTGESPLSLAITSPQINELQTATKSSRSRLVGSKNHTISSNGGVGCSQSTSLFDLQNQHTTTSHSQLSLRQTSSVEISQSKAPLVERILLLLIKSGAILDFRNSDGRTPLHVAAMKSNFWALKTLLDLGASTESRDTNGLTPLFLSVLHKAELKVTQLLLNHTNSSSTSSDSIKSIGISDQHGWQAIHYAAKYGLSGHIEKLLYYGCDINAKVSGSGNTPLHVAAINDQLQVAQVLLLRGSDRTITNNSHQNAHQVAVISNNMDLAEFIASHDETKVMPFDHHRPNNFASGHSAAIQQVNNSNRSSISSAQQFLVKSDSSSTNLSNNLQAHHNVSSSSTTTTTTTTRTGIVQPQLQEHQNKQQLQPDHQQQQLSSLTLDVANHYASSVSSSAPTTNTSGTSHQTARSSLLSIDTSSLPRDQQHRHNHQLNVQVSNISPCLSQRSCATSNTTTTSSSGVCCDGDGHNSEDLNNSGGKPDPSCRSNVTIISIANNAVGKDNCNIDNRAAGLRQPPPPQPANQYRRTANEDRIVSTFASGGGGSQQPPSLHQSNSALQLNGQLNRAAGGGGGDQSDSECSSSSSSDGLYSLMSENKPLYVGSMVKATNCYESGDPKHLQLRREDLIEILECPADLIQDGQLPRLANKPMLYGRRELDGACGLFPSFCVRRSKRRSTASSAPRNPLLDVTNLSRQQHATANERQSTVIRSGSTKLPESQSMAAFGVAADAEQDSPTTFAQASSNHYQASPKVTSPVSFREFKVTLEKINEGFGFVLRGARIDPATLSLRAGAGDTPGKISIDENLMAANKLASLQYFSDIEPNSIADQNGLKRGDFLVSVNNHDVRLCSHEQVVQMIRQSGAKVHLTIARIAEPIMSFSSKTLTRVKPEPPKRDPNTTLTRNKASRIKSMFVVPQQHHQHQALMRAYGDRFDADKPLPDTPMMMMNSSSSPMSGLNRSVSTNLSHFSSANSLSSAAPDSQSITSISTVESGQVAQNSSSSTTTLTTVATTKPKTAPKPNDLYPKTTMTNSSNPQPTYQSAAVIITSKRSSQDHTSPLGTTAAASQAAKQSSPPSLSHVPAPPPPPPLPPPPPPMPDFSATPAAAVPSGERLSQRRTSAPVNQATPMIKIDRNQLLKKRDSLASVAAVADSNNLGATPICTVAAACAAAANNRLLRQQQRQQAGLLENDSQERRADGEPVGQDGITNRADTQKQELIRQTESQSGEVNGTEVTSTDVLPSREQIVAETKEIIKPSEQVQKVGLLPKSTESIRRDSNHLVTHNSATLGRKSSAQIIQQPKQNSNSAAHSQTLKIVTTKQRMSILDHEVFPQPPPAPPSLLPPPMFAEQQGVDQKLMVHQSQSHTHTHGHHQRSHSNYQEEKPIEHQHQKVSGNLLNQMQMQQQQHQMILRHQQQLRQQQQLQERIRLQQIRQQQVQQQQQQCPHHHHRHMAHHSRTLMRSDALTSREHQSDNYQYAHHDRGDVCYQHQQQPNAIDMMSTPAAMAPRRHQHFTDQQHQLHHHTLPLNNHHSHQHQHSHRHHQHQPQPQPQPQLVSTNDNLRSANAHHQHLNHYHHSHQNPVQQSTAHYHIEQQQRYMQQLDPRVAPVHR